MKGDCGRIIIDIEDDRFAGNPKRVAWMLRQLADDIETGTEGQSEVSGFVWWEEYGHIRATRVARYKWRRRPALLGGVL
jgi:hypothetical protein